MGIVSALALTIGVSAFGIPSATAATPAEFTDTAVAALAAPTALAVMPDGRMLVTQQSGKLRVLDAGALLTVPAIDLSARICNNSERGLLGVATDPDPSSKAIFLFYTARGTDPSCPRADTGDPESAGAPHHRVSRFVLRADNTIDPASETVLLDGIKAPAGAHNAGDLHVGQDGDLYITTGDGGCDYHGDTRFPGGSGCGATNDASRDRNILNGKVLRVRKTGGVPASNPFVGKPGTVSCRTSPGPAGSTCAEAYAVGLRNPFRFAFDPNATGTSFRINDVGQDVWEEIDKGTAGADYGWPLREGHCQQTGSPDRCGTATPPAFTDPIYDYSHTGGCKSITGGAFVPDGIWPAAFTGAYLFSDYVCGKIFALSPAGVRTDFVTGMGDSTAVDLSFGPSGTGQALYYTTYGGGGQVRKITYTGTANRPPTAVLAAHPAVGSAPLAVTLDGSASTDPDGGALTYLWTFGDPSPGISTTSATIGHTYPAGDWTATLRVRDPAGAISPPSTVAISSGNHAPVVTITSPAVGQLFTVGTTITLQGSATDPEDGALPAGALSWTVSRHHDTHTHPFLGPVTGNTVPFTAPGPEDLAAAANSHLQVRLTATDSRGVATTAVRDLLPRTVPITLATSPAGRTVTVNGTQFVGPATVTSWAGWGLQVGVPTQSDANGVRYGFDSWSDGGAVSHVYSTPSGAATLTARLSPRTAPGLATAVHVQQSGVSAAVLTWQPPTTNGGSPITGYRVARTGVDTKGQGPWSTVLPATARSQTFTLLRAGASYTLSVQAINAFGTGRKVTGTVKMVASPGPPVIGTATAGVTTDTSISVTGSWQAPTSGGTVTGYTVTAINAATGRTKTVTATATARSKKITGLLAGSSYAVQVSATNASGSGPVSARSNVVPAR